jgi:two-component system cell cycle response regulator CtrA
MRVLLIEPDEDMARAVELVLIAEGFNVFATDLGQEGVDCAKHYDYDIILLETALLDMSGVEAIRQIRAAKVSTPILVISALDEIAERVRAFGAGADDFLGKPFHRDEMVARMHAIVRRSRGHAQSVIVTDGLSIDVLSKTVEVDGKPVHMTAKEFAILELLALRKGKTITKEMLLNHMYGGIDEPEIKIIDVFVCKVRRKLMTAAADRRNHIETIWGRGYVLRDRAAREGVLERGPELAA